jgi:hypothetical protein
LGRQERDPGERARLGQGGRRSAPPCARPPPSSTRPATGRPT